MGTRSRLALLAICFAIGGCAAGERRPQPLAEPGDSSREATSAAAAPASPPSSTDPQSASVNDKRGGSSALQAQREQELAITDVPRCARKIGTLAIVDGDDPRGWTSYSLGPPQKLLKLLVQRSGCFDLVDRGSGLSAAERERAIGGNLGLQRGSNVGRGQIKAADYVLVAELQRSVGAEGNNAAGGLIGGLVGGRFGGLAGGVRTKKVEANTVLSITNVRTTETVATTEGYAAKRDLNFAGGGALGGLGAVGGGYDNTEVGRVATLSFIQAYAKLVTELGAVAPSGQPTMGGAIRSYIAERSIALRATASTAARVIRTLPGGAAVYRTGRAAGPWWEVADERDNVGWVLNTGLVASTNDFRVAGPEEQLLPWPPPRPSAMADVTAKFRKGAALGSYDHQLRAMLNRRGYANLRYFSVPNGFGITTNVERLDDLGRPHRNRWNRKPPPPGGILDYVRQLIQGDTGRFRVLVFIVSDQEPRPASYRAKQLDLDRWQESGQLALSGQTARRSSPSLRVWMLAYEFVSSKSKSGDLVADNEGAFPVDVHTSFLGLR